MAYLTQFSGSVPVIKFNIDQSVITIGQDLEMDICVAEDGISDNHATIEAIKNNDSYRFIIKSREDEPQINLNGETVSVAELRDGDWIILGNVEFQFSDDGIYDIQQVEMPAEIEKPAEQEVPLLELVEDEVIQPAAVNTVQDVIEEVEPLAADSVHSDHRFSRRLNFF